MKVDLKSAAALIEFSGSFGFSAPNWNLSAK
jgi:hypothetical protein